jgi:hypothetical protein
LIAVFDASVLVFLFSEDASAPIDPSTDSPVQMCQSRVTHLLAELQKSKTKIIIPAPALAEVLVYAGTAAPEWLRIVSTSKHFRVAPFDELAAVEFAANQAARSKGVSKEAGPTRRKAKFDDQIYAIAAVERADVIYSDDADIRKLAGDRLRVVGIADLPLAAPAAQGALQFEPVSEEPPSDEAE